MTRSCQAEGPADKAGIQSGLKEAGIRLGADTPQPLAETLGEAPWEYPRLARAQPQKRHEKRLPAPVVSTTRARRGGTFKNFPLYKSERTFLALSHHGRSSEASMKQAQSLPHVAGSISTHELAGQNGVVHMGQPTLKSFTRIGKITDHRHPQLLGATDGPRDLPRESDHQSSRPAPGRNMERSKSGAPLSMARRSGTMKRRSPLSISLSTTAVVVG